jgi:hypothetical protein
VDAQYADFGLVFFTQEISRDSCRFDRRSLRQQDRFCVVEPVA